MGTIEARMTKLPLALGLTAAVVVSGVLIWKAGQRH